MDYSNWISIALIVVAGLVGWFVASRRVTSTEPTPGESAELTEARIYESEVAAALAEGQLVSETVLTGVQMAEQLYTSGKIARNERNQKALDYIATVLESYNIAVDMDKIVQDVESAVFVVNTAASYIKLAQLGNTSAPAPNTGTTWSPPAADER